jgi:hypothetical protein
MLGLLQPCFLNPPFWTRGKGTTPYLQRRGVIAEPRHATAQGKSHNQTRRQWHLVRKFNIPYREGMDKERTTNIFEQVILTYKNFQIICVNNYKKSWGWKTEGYNQE